MKKYAVALVIVSLITILVSIKLIEGTKSPEQIYQTEVPKIEKDGNYFKKVMDDGVVDKEEATAVVEFEKVNGDTDFTEYLHDLDENKVSELGIQSYKKDVENYVIDAKMTAKFLSLVQGIIDFLPVLIVVLIGLAIDGSIIIAMKEKYEAKKRKDQELKKTGNVYRL